MTGNDREWQEMGERGQDCHWWQQIYDDTVTAMTLSLTSFWLLVAVLLVLAALVATVRTTRHDRSTRPPGSPRDWRDDALSWNRLPIR